MDGVDSGVVVVACVNVVAGIRSTYRWKGEVERADEALLVIKTSRAGVEALKSALPELHPYEVPELVVLPVEGGAETYLRWVVDNAGG
jgi:periplasmic divalent cation tolerance protein